MKTIRDRLTEKIGIKLSEIDSKPKSDFKGEDITREQMAKSIGVSKSTLYNVIRGVASLESMFKAAKYFEIELI